MSDYLLTVTNLIDGVYFELLISEYQPKIWSQIPKKEIL